MADFSLTAASIRPLNGAIWRPFTLGGSASVGDVVYEASAGTVIKANAAAVATAKAIGIIISIGTGGATSGASGDPCDVVLWGPVTGFSSLTPGARAYVSAATAGKLATAAPAATDAVTWLFGHNYDATTVMVAPVMVAPQTAIADPSGGATTDSQARTAIASIINALEANGILVQA